eukprot:59674-Prorocentrum_minimum.AAC.1
MAYGLAVLDTEAGALLQQCIPCNVYLAYHCTVPLHCTSTATGRLAHLMRRTVLYHRTVPLHCTATTAGRRTNPSDAPHCTVPPYCTTALRCHNCGEAH